MGGCPGMVDIYDLEGVGWGQMSSGVRLLSGVLAVAQANYPENLSQAFLINAPGFFAGAWRLIAGAIDKRTQQKFSIRRDSAADALDVLLGARGAGRAAVWRLGDRQLGGGTDEVAELSADGGWRHEDSVVVGPPADADGARPRRLVWRFDLKGVVSVDFVVQFTPAGGVEAGSEVLPRKSYSGPVRGAIDHVHPGRYLLVWQGQPRGFASRPQPLRCRCWLQSSDEHLLGPLQDRAAEATPLVAVPGKPVDDRNSEMETGNSLGALSLRAAAATPAVRPKSELGALGSSGGISPRAYRRPHMPPGGGSSCASSWWGVTLCAGVGVGGVVSCGRLAFRAATAAER